MSLLEMLLNLLIFPYCYPSFETYLISGTTQMRTWITFTCCFLFYCVSNTFGHELSLYIQLNQQNSNLESMHLYLQHLQTTMNPVYSPASTGVPFTNTKGMGYPGKFKPFAATHEEDAIIKKNSIFLNICFCPLFFVMLAGFPVGYAAAAAPAYTPNVYAGANPAFPSGEFSLPPTELLTV